MSAIGKEVLRELYAPYDPSANYSQTNTERYRAIIGQDQPIPTGEAAHHIAQKTRTDPSIVSDYFRNTKAEFCHQKLLGIDSFLFIHDYFQQKVLLLPWGWNHDGAGVQIRQIQALESALSGQPAKKETIIQEIETSYPDLQVK